MRPITVDAQSYLIDGNSKLVLEPCFDGLFQFHCANTPGAPPWLFLKAVAKQESMFSPWAVSGTGPVGLGQFALATWQARRPGKDRLDVFEMTGAMAEEYASHFHWARQHGVSESQIPRFALGCYNAGIGNITRAMLAVSAENMDPLEWGNIPHTLVQIVGPMKVEEVVNYVNNIMEFWARYEHPSQESQ